MTDLYRDYCVNTLNQTAVYMFCGCSMLERTVWPFPLTRPSVSQLQQRAERSCQCRIIKTSVEVTGSLGGMQHSKAPLLSCFLCELSRPLRIYSSMAQHSPLPSTSQTDVTFKPPSLGLNTILSAA